MENVSRSGVGFGVAALSWFAPVEPLVCCALVFVAIDFLTGVLAGYKRSRRRGEPWYFESAKAWKTIYKLVFICGGIVLTWLLDSYVLGFAGLNLSGLFTGFVCGVELWSYLENAAEISEHPVFRLFRKVVEKRLDDFVPPSDDCI